MRKVAGIGLAVALMLPVGIVAASPAGAAGKTVCKAAKGSAVFKPPLPDLTKTKKVKNTLTATGKVTKCSGAVKSGKIKFVSPKSKTGANCTTLATPDPKSKGTVGKFTITWNNNKKSVVGKFAIKQLAKNPTQATTKGKITKGLFKGKKVIAKVSYTLPNGACTAGHPLKKVTYKNIGKFVIK
jgi:hypothetical protein